jgi:hypothetical protein
MKSIYLMLLQYLIISFASFASILIFILLCFSDD